MESNFWIVNEWLIFKPEFNEELTYYYDIINKYKKVMFSNYNKPLIAIEINNDCSKKCVFSWWYLYFVFV